MKIGSLFSGIGGLELGLEWSGIGETVWQVEQCEKCRDVLARHWPEAERFDDVRTVGAHNLRPVDLICGGFPCQDISSAGKGAGLGGSRSGLWFEFHRIIKELRPRWCVVENVARASLWVDEVMHALQELSYTCLPIPLAARDCGAFQRRPRVIVIAYSDGQRELQPQRLERNERRRAIHSDWWPSRSSVAPVVYGVPADMASIAQLGNSVVPQCAQVVGEVIKLIMTD